MRRILTLSVALLSLTTLAAEVRAAETVKLTGMHICCGGCTSGIKNAVKGIEGVSVTVDQDAEEATVIGDTKEAAQKGVDAILAAGYHASVNGKSLPTAKAPEGKVKRLTVSNAHNCCGACTKAIQGAIKTVDGVQADTCKPRQPTFVIEGDFDAAAVLKALADAGFHVDVQ